MFLSRTDPLPCEDIYGENYDPSRLKSIQCCLNDFIELSQSQILLEQNPLCRFLGTTENACYMVVVENKRRLYLYLFERLQDEA